MFAVERANLQDEYRTLELQKMIINIKLLLKAVLHLELLHLQHAAVVTVIFISSEFALLLSVFSDIAL